MSKDSHFTGQPVYSQILKLLDKEKILQILLRLYEAESDFDNMISTLNRLELLDGTSEEITFAKMQVFDKIGDKKKAC